MCYDEANDHKGSVIMKLAIGNDHAAVELKEEIVAFLEEKGIEVVDFGAKRGERCDYPVPGYRVGKAIADGAVDGGVLICGSGVGISLAANKVPGVRCCLCSEPYSAKLSREHNDSNAIAFGARVVGNEMAKMIVESWLNAEFEGGRHQPRVDLLAAIERGEEL